jgi:hypothetical protein
MFVCICTPNSNTIKIKLEFTCICVKGNDFAPVSRIWLLYIYHLFGRCGIFSYSFYQSNQEPSKTYYMLNIRYSIYSVPHRWWNWLACVERGFEPRSGQTKHYKISICCFFAKHTPLRRNSKDWLPRNQDNVSKLGSISICGLLFQWACSIESQLSVMV